MTEAMTGLQSLGSLELPPQHLPEIELILKQQEQPIIFTMMDYFYEAGVGTQPNFLVGQYVTAKMSQNNQLINTVKNGLIEIGKGWTDSDLNMAGSKAIEFFQAEAYARAYVTVTVERALNGSPIRSKDMDALQVIQNFVDSKDGRIHPAHNRIRDIIWGSIGTALESDDGLAPFAVKDINSIGKAVSPSLDHKINRTLTKAMDIFCKIQDGKKFSPKRLDELVETMGHPVSEEVRQFGPTAHNNYNIVVAQIADYYRRQTSLDSQRKEQLQKLLKYLHVDVDEMENVLLVPYDPEEYVNGGETRPSPDNRANMAAEPPIETMTKLRTDFDYETGDISNTRVQIVPKKYDKGKIIATVAASVVGVAGLAGGAALHHDKDSKSNWYTVSPSTHTPESSTPEAGGDVAEQPATTPEVQSQPAPGTTEPTQTASSAPSIDVDTQASPGATPHETGHHAKPPSIPDHVNLDHVQEVGAPSASEARPITTGNSSATAQEALLNDLMFKDLASATTALEGTLLAHDTTISESPNTAFTEQVNEVTENIDEIIQTRFESGTMMQEDYAKYREMITSARVLASRPGLAQYMTEQRSSLIKNGNEALFIQAYIEHELPVHNMLGGYEQADHYELIAQFLGNAAAFSIPEATQLQYLGSLGIEVETPQSEDSSDHDQQDENGNNSSDDGYDGSDDSHAEQDDNAHSGTHEASGNLSEAQSKALDEMEGMGPEWHNRAIIMRELFKLGWSPTAVSAIIGNACVEAAGCNIDPGIEQPGGDGKGGWQWGTRNPDHPEWDRFGYFEGAEQPDTLMWYAANHGGKWDDLDMQIGFLNWELTNTFKDVGDDLRDVKSLEAANLMFVERYEIAGDPNVSLRLHYTQETFDMYQNLLDKQQQTSINHSETGPEAHADQFPSADAIKEYFHDKYHGSENGQLSNEDLELIGNAWGQARLYPAAAEAFRRMSVAFEAEFGRPLQLSGGASDAYRDLATQESLAEQKPGLAAIPGTSNHGYGLATDLGGGVNSGPGSPEYDWTVKYAKEFGFEHPDWAVDPSHPGFKEEWWHLEYVGGKVAEPDHTQHEDSSDGQASGGDSGSDNPGQDQDHETQSQSDLQNFPGPVSQSGYGLTLPASAWPGITNPYLNTTSDGGVHTGGDSEVDEDTPVLAMRNGTVMRLAYASGEEGADPNGAGNWIMVKFDDGKGMLVEHLKLDYIDAGDRVRLGDMIGRSGDTGNTTGPHLHVTMLEEGFDYAHDFPSRTDPLAEIEAETNDPADYYPTADEIKAWLKTHPERIVNDATELVDGVIEGTTETLDDLGDTLTQEPVTSPEQSTPDPSFEQQTQRRLGGTMMTQQHHPAFNEAGEDLSD